MKDKAPLATIALPSYNHAPYVATALRSLFKQSIKDFEIIIIDDGSTDNSPQVIEKTLRENPGLDLTFTTQNNIGLSATLNRALSMARGTFFGFLPSDDYYDPQKLEKQLRILQAHSSLAACYTWQCVVDETGNPTTDQDILDWFDVSYVSSLSFFPHLLERNFLPAPSALARTDMLISLGGFEESLVYAQDHDLWLRLLRSHEGMILHERLLFYRWHGKNLTFTETPQTRTEKRYLLEKFVRSLTPWDKRVMENRDRMRYHLSNSCVEQVEDLLEEFDRRTDPQVSNPSTECSRIMLPDPRGELAALGDHLRYTEERLLELRNERQWLVADRLRLLEENESLKIQLQRQENFREQVCLLVNQLHSLRMLRSWKVLRLMQIIRTGLFTWDISRWRFFFTWALKRVRGESTAFVYRPDPLQILQEIDLSITPEESVPSLFSVPRPLLIYPGDRKDSLLSAAFWLGERDLPLVSVLLPVYNQAHLLAEAVESILAQDYPHLELIILDDGSDDDLETVLQEYVFHPCVRIYRQSNRKLPRTLTLLHGLAGGELITWISSDNLMEPHMVSTLAQTLMARPETAMAYGDPCLIDDQGAPYREGEYRPHNLDHQNKAVLRLHREDHYLGVEPDNYINAAFLYRTPAARALGGRHDPRLPGLEDYDFWLRLQKAGPIVHVRNDQPLYRYRVHPHTMSQQLFQKEAAIHYERTQILMETEQRRRRWVEKRWGVYAHPGLGIRERKELELACRDLPVDWKSTPGNPGHKVLTFLPSAMGECDVQAALGSAVVISDFVMELVHYHKNGVSKPGIVVPRGTTISPLARKARDWNPEPTDPLLKRAAGRPILGCHFPPVAYPLDIEWARRIMKAHPELFFVFLDTPDASSSINIHLLMEGMDNAAFWGPADFGACYQAYAAWSAVWLPPGKGHDQSFVWAVRQAASLGFAAGKWLLCVNQVPFKELIPYLVSWEPFRDGCKILAELTPHPPDYEVLNRYLRRWSVPGRVAELLAYADAALQDAAAPALERLNELALESEATDRPDLQPQAWFPSPRVLISGPLIFQVDRFGQGGLERMVAMLALGFHASGKEVVVLCAHEGGSLGQELQRRGLPVYCAEGDSTVYQSMLEEIKPVLINTHYSWFGLESAKDRNIPVVATIHNMYAWYSDDDWKQEKAHSLRADHFVAVSPLVKHYYLKRMVALASHQVNVIPNCYDPHHLRSDERMVGREKLGLSPDDFLFLNLASYDGRKNQLGLLTAFNLAAAEDSTIKLLCAGDPASSEYFDLVLELLDKLAARDRIEIRGYESDVASLWAAADAFVLPSYLEGWSLSATEALAVGLPLIHTCCGSAYELCGKNEERGLVVENPAGDPLELSRDVLYSLIFNPAPPHTDKLASALVRMAREQRYWSGRRRSIAAYGRRCFSEKTFISRYERVFGGVLSH
jgi:glycosyltransferase involved in cell wall biosynthesis